MGEVTEPKWDRLIKMTGAPTIWMVRERTKSRVRIEHWENYVEMGEPPFAIVSREELNEYRAVSYFRG